MLWTLETFVNETTTHHLLLLLFTFCLLFSRFCLREISIVFVCCVGPDAFGGQPIRIVKAVACDACNACHRNKNSKISE